MTDCNWTKAHTDRRSCSMVGLRCNSKSRLSSIGCVLLLCSFFEMGCSRHDPASRIGEMNDMKIKQLANLYMAHQTRNGSNGPKDEVGFREFIQKKMPAHRLEMMRVDPAKIDDLFVSDRDGQPFVIKYGQSGGVMSKTPVVFEKEGKDGTLQVA